MSSTYYDISTGRGIARSFSGHGGPATSDSVGRVEGFYDLDTLYFPGGVPTDRSAINYTLDKPTIVAAGGEFATVTGLPDGCMIYFSTDEIQSENGGFTFDATSVGFYQFIIDVPAFLKTTILIEAI